MIIRPKPTLILLLEWAGGLFVSELIERLIEYYVEDGREIVLRLLKLRSGERTATEAALEAFVTKLFIEGSGRNEVIPVGQVLSAASKQIVFIGDDSEKHDNLDELFCSKTVAACYKSVGLIPARRLAADVLPKHFSYSHDRFLALQRGARLSKEVALTFEPPELRNSMLALFGVTAALKRTAEKAAVVAIQKQFRRFAAVKRVQRHRAGSSPAHVIERCTQCIAACRSFAAARSPASVLERHVAHSTNGCADSAHLTREFEARISVRASRAPPMPRPPLGEALLQRITRSGAC
mmetsp:Transcript_37812/g.100016  ORF Transcript_37812/g.100016 Transcript_37812/m.100016 type:complete len:294 (+) Transcript_37812:332-1213(+)